MKLLAENGEYSLWYAPERANQYRVFKTAPMSLSGDLKLNTEVESAFKLTKKIKSYFTKAQIDTAYAKLHAMVYVNKRFKS